MGDAAPGQVGQDQDDDEGWSVREQEQQDEEGGQRGRFREGDPYEEREQRLHARADLEAALKARRIEPLSFESHLKMFELGMPPHGGLAIGLERLTAQVLGLANVREATLYPRDRYRLAP